MAKSATKDATGSEAGAAAVEEAGAVVLKETAGLPATIDLSSTIGEGFEETDASSFAIPFLKVLQSMSAQCKRSNAEYIEGAYEGMFYNTVTGEVFDGTVGLQFIPVHFRRKMLEWQGTLDEGGGLVAQHDAAAGEALLAQCTRDSDGNDRLPNNHIIQDVREHYGLFIHPVTKMIIPVVLSLASTQIKKSKRFMSNMGAMKRNPMQPRPDASYTHVYKLTTVPEKKDTFDFFGINIAHSCGIEDAAEIVGDVARAFEAAQEFRGMVRSGKAQPVAPGADDDVPF